MKSRSNHIFVNLMEALVNQDARGPGKGAPVVTAAIVAIVPRQETGWHEHDAPRLVGMFERP